MMFGKAFKAIGITGMAPSYNIDIDSIVCTEIPTADGPYIVIFSHRKDQPFKLLSVRKCTPEQRLTPQSIDIGKVHLLLDTDMSSFIEPPSLVAIRFPRGGPLYPPFKICSNCKPLGRPRDELDSRTKVLTHSHFTTLGLLPNASQHEITDQWNLYDFLFNPKMQWPWYAETAELALDQVYEAGNELYDLKLRSKYTAKIVLKLITFEDASDPAHDMVEQHEARMIALNKRSEEAWIGRSDDIDNEEAHQNRWYEDPIRMVLRCMEEEESYEDQDLREYEEFLSTSVYVSYKTDDCGNPDCYRPNDPTFSRSIDELTESNSEADVVAKVTVMPLEKPYATFCATFPRLVGARKGIIVRPRVHHHLNRPRLTRKEKCKLVFVRRRTRKVIRDHPNIPPASVLPRLAGGLRRLTQMMRKQTGLQVRYFRKHNKVFMK